MAKDKEIRNIVDFPGGVAKSGLNEKLDDPLEELLNEFHEYEKELEESFETLYEPECFRDVSPPESDLIEEQLKTLEEVQSRLQFYWKEIETYLYSK